jgi:hypothetical protein
MESSSPNPAGVNLRVRTQGRMILWVLAGSMAKDQAPAAAPQMTLTAWSSSRGLGAPTLRTEYARLILGGGRRGCPRYRMRGRGGLAGTPGRRHPRHCLPSASRTR